MPAMRFHRRGIIRRTILTPTRSMRRSIADDYDIVGESERGHVPRGGYFFRATGATRASAARGATVSPNGRNRPDANSRP